MSERVGVGLALMVLGFVLGILAIPVFKALTAAIQGELRRFQARRDKRRLGDLAARTWPAREYERIEEDW